jgi:hypothetical protein
VIEKPTLLRAVVGRTCQPRYPQSAEISWWEGLTEVEQNGDLFRGGAEGSRGEENVEVCGELEDFGVVRCFEESPSEDED